MKEYAVVLKGDHGEPTTIVALDLLIGRAGQLEFWGEVRENGSQPVLICFAPGTWYSVKEII